MRSEVLCRGLQTPAVMLPLMLLISSLLATGCVARPTTESTHVLLQRLGFDEVRKPIVNHHRKRVAQDTIKARHHIDGYNTETDSHMFVVKLPPHSPYYSHMIPERFENEVTSSSSKGSVNFRTNGKPAGVYHWNIPVLKKLPQARYNPGLSPQGDSKIYHLKILPEEYAKDKPYKKFNKLKRQRYEDRQDKIKQAVYQKSGNNVRVYSVKKDHHFNSMKKVGRVELTKTNVTRVKSKSSPRDKVAGDNALRDAIKSKSKTKDKRQSGPSYYQPALPKQNSFHKDFTGNGKPKSFYVIEKSNKATRYHRLF